MPRTNLTLRERFDLKWKSDSSGCWIWKASKNKQGYGYFKLDGRMQKAHRVSWMIFSGSVVKDDTCVLHHCDNPSCVRPNHLFLGTYSDNLIDSFKKGRRDQHRGSGVDWVEIRGVKGKKRSRCNRGHPFSGSNLYINRSGYQICRACSRLSYIRRRHETGKPVTIS